MTRSRSQAFHTGMAGSCVESSWRRRAVIEELTSSPRIVVLAVLGVGFLIIGIVVDSTGFGAPCIFGAALLTAAVVFPLVTKASIGSSLFTFGFERSDTTREQAVVAIDEEYGATLSDVAQALSGRDERVRDWVKQTCACAYRDSPLVPRDQQRSVLLCVLIRTVRDSLSASDLLTSGAQQSVRTEPFLLLPFDERAALLLRRMQFSAADGAQILHCDVVEFNARVERGQRQLDDRASERP